MSALISTFTNPATGTCYRLMGETAGWRISKVRTDNGRLRLVHLRGQHGGQVVDAVIVARFVAGHGGVVAQPVDPSALLAAVVVMDMDHTADVLTAIARESESVYIIGCRGFRPRSPVLRQQRVNSVAKAMVEMRAMALAWRGSRLVAAGALPVWLSAALEDGP